MTKNDSSIDSDIIDTWIDSKKVIEEFLTDLKLGLTKEQLVRNSSALIARLAQENLFIERYQS